MSKILRVCFEKKFLRKVFFAFCRAKRATSAVCDYFSSRDTSLDRLTTRVSFSIKAGKRNIEYSNGRGHKFASASN